MKNISMTIKENRKITESVYFLTLAGDTSSIMSAGEFVEVKLPGFYLRRPFSVADYDKNNLYILYKVLGKGTDFMTTISPNTCLDVLVGLGNGFRFLASKAPLLIGGGIGIAPLFNLAKRFNGLGIRPVIILGFRNKAEVFYVAEFQKLGDVIITTDDGSLGYKGNAVSYLKENKVPFDKYYACGPLIMLKCLIAYSKEGYVSLEARMGCGFGACMGCSIETTNGPARVCKEGPVFKAGEVIL